MHALLLLLPLLAAPADSLRPIRPPRWHLYGGVVAGVARPSMRIENNLGADADQLVEPLYLLGQDVDARRRPLGGLQLGLESPGRRWALHTETTARQFGGYRQQFQTGYADFPTKTYHMRATALSTTLGVRYQQPLGAHWHVFAGLGLSYTRWLGIHAGTVYDGVSSRAIEDYALPVSGTFMQGLNAAPNMRADGYSGGHWGRYAEIGAQYGRWSLALSFRRSGTHTFDDPSAAMRRQASRLDGSLRGFLMTHGYYATPRAAVLTLGYRLFDPRP